MQNSKFYRNIPLTFSRITLHAPTKVILEFYKSKKLAYCLQSVKLCCNDFSPNAYVKNKKNIRGVKFKQTLKKCLLIRSK